MNKLACFLILVTSVALADTQTDIEYARVGETSLKLDLHRFNWLEDDAIGELELEWNWLVREYTYSADARIAHFTRGGPWFPEYRDSDYAGEWFDEFESMKVASG